MSRSLLKNSSGVVLHIPVLKRAAVRRIGLSESKLAFETATDAGHSNMLIVLRNDLRDWTHVGAMLRGFQERARRAGLHDMTSSVCRRILRRLAGSGTHQSGRRPTIVISDNDVVTTLVGLAWDTEWNLKPTPSSCLPAG